MVWTKAELDGKYLAQNRTVSLCQRTLEVHADEYPVLFAFTRNHARLEQINRHIYLLLKKEKHSNLDT
jgi:hypothetical protein